jgi:hypothetical protein
MRLYYQIPVGQWPEMLDIALEILSIIFCLQSGKVFTCRICILDSERVQIIFVLASKEGNVCFQTGIGWVAAYWCSVMLNLQIVIMSYTINLTRIKAALPNYN